MEALLEVTDWKISYKFPNHIYLVDGSKILGYIKHGVGEPEYFQKPKTLDKSRRKFLKVTPNPFKIKPKTNLISVQGSKGSVYYIDPDLKTCTCSGFQFRKKCKHINSI
jgi:hypothetical protein